IHVCVRAVIDMADEPRFRKGFDFKLEAKRGQTAKLFGLVLESRRRLPSERNVHGVAPERNAARVMHWTATGPFTRTSPSRSPISSRHCTRPVGPTISPSSFMGAWRAIPAMSGASVLAVLAGGNGQSRSRSEPSER